MDLVYFSFSIWYFFSFIPGLKKYTPKHTSGYNYKYKLPMLSEITEKISKKILTTKII